MKKRLVVLLLVVLLLVSGCGKKEEKVDSNKDKNNDVQVEPKVEEKKLTIIDVTDIVISTTCEKN